MNQEEIYQFVERYLEAQECPIRDKQAGYLTTQLTVEVDKDITNRPYYWLFVERTGAQPEPMEITFLFDPEQSEQVRGELLQFGCWRLHQIFSSAKKHGQFVRLYEQSSSPTAQQGLVPWLCLNFKLSFICDQKKDLYYPVGFNLINGQILPNFDQILDSYSLTPKIPDFQYTIRPIFSLSSAVQRLEEHIRDYVAAQDERWAVEANQRLEDELALIHSFFSEQEEKQLVEKRVAELEEYRARVEVDVINTGLIYLSHSPKPSSIDQQDE